MSTHAAIILKTKNGKYRGIYCHFDGYKEGVGYTLLDHYNNYEKINELINLGDISCLGERINPIGKHTFDSPEEETTIAYMRDRGEEGCEARESDVLEDIIDDIDPEYYYVFENGKWYINGKILKSK